MRKFRGKKVLAIAAASLLAMSMMGSGMSAMAATTINIDGTFTGTFTAYKVFIGTQNTGTTELAVTGWGDGFEGVLSYDGDRDGKADLLTWINEGRDEALAAVTLDDILAYLKELAVSDPTGASSAFARILNGYVNFVDDDSKFMTSILEDGASLDDEGYYLVVNKNATGVQNPSLLQVTGEAINITVKTNQPELTKLVWENDYLDNKDGSYGNFQGGAASIEDTQWNDTADYEIGERVPFKLTAIIPGGTTNEYDSYEITFVDSMMDGLELDSDFAEEDVEVYYKIEGDNTIYPLSSGYDVTRTDAQHFRMVISDVKQLYPEQTVENWNKDLEIYVMFTAEMKQKVETSINSTYGEENAAYLIYDSDYDGEGTKETVPDTVVVFTYELDLIKIDNDHAVLPGAEFLLYRVESGQTLTAEDLAVERIENTDNEYQLSGLSDLLSAEKISPVTAVKGEKVIAGNDQTSEVYFVDNTEQAGEIFVSGATGYIMINGVDRGDYVLVEKKAPDGYNNLNTALLITVKEHDTTPYERDEYYAGLNAYQGQNEPVVLMKFVVSAIDKTGNETPLTDNQIFIKNIKGSLLPETGGEGTMVLYIIGTVMMAGGVFYFTSKGRRHSEEE